MTGSRNAPAIGRLEFQVIPDASTRVAAYERGDVDLVQLPPEDYLRLNRDPVRAREIRQVPRATTSFFIDPVEELIMIFMTQVLPSNAYPLRRELRTMVYAAITDSNL